MAPPRPTTATQRRSLPIRYLSLNELGWRPRATSAYGHWVTAYGRQPFAHGRFYNSVVLSRLSGTVYNSRHSCSVDPSLGVVKASTVVLVLHGPSRASAWRIWLSHFVVGPDHRLPSHTSRYGGLHPSRILLAYQCSPRLTLPLSAVAIVSLAALGLFLWSSSSGLVALAGPFCLLIRCFFSRRARP